MHLGSHKTTYVTNKDAIMFTHAGVRAHHARISVVVKDLRPKDKDKDLSLKDEDKDKDVSSVNEDKDKDLRLKDKDKDKDLNSLPTASSMKRGPELSR
jgi:hypothetical protein